MATISDRLLHPAGQAELWVCSPAAANVRAINATRIKSQPKSGGARSEQEPVQGDEFRLASATCEVLLMFAVACPTVVRSVTGRFACARSLAFVLTSCFSPAVANSEGGDLSFSGDENRDSTDPTLVRSSEFGSSFFF